MLYILSIANTTPDAIAPALEAAGIAATILDSLGVADMAHAILADRPHRASGDLALHVLEVMEAFDVSSREGRTVDIQAPVERPAPISESLVDGRIG